MSPHVARQSTRKKIRRAQVLRDDDEWSCWNKREDPVLHIELRKWADVFLVAPLSANTLAKMANGLCDNLLTCVARAWDFKRPLLVAPAMNTLMWESPFTAKVGMTAGEAARHHHSGVPAAVGSAAEHASSGPSPLQHLKELESLGVRVVPPVSKRLVCGDVGTGAMAEVHTLTQAARTACEELQTTRGLLHTIAA